MEDVTCIGENRSDGVESLETCGFETASHGVIRPPAVGMGISTSVPAVTIPPQLSGLSSRNFPLPQAAFSIQGPPNPYLPQDNVAAPIACNSTGSFHPNGYPLSLYTRPRFSYCALIAMSIQSLPRNMATVHEIYKFVTTNFPFYRLGDKKWKSSIRHNLTRKKFFQKAPREDGLHGRGNYWIIDPACDRVVENGNFISPARKRKSNRKSSNIGAENRYNHDDGNRKVESDESLAMCQAGSILNPSMSAAEIVIPPIHSSSHNGVTENPYFTPGIQAGSVAVEFKAVSSNDPKDDLTILTPGLAREQQNIRSTGELPFYTQRDIAIVENHAMQQHASHTTRNGEISCSNFGIEKLLS